MSLAFLVRLAVKCQSSNRPLDKASQRKEINKQLPNLWIHSRHERTTAKQTSHFTNQVYILNCPLATTHTEILTLSNLLCIRYEMVFPSLLENINLHSNAFKMSQWSRAQISSDMKPGTVRGSISLYLFCRALWRQGVAKQGLKFKLYDLVE